MQENILVCSVHHGHKPTCFEPTNNSWWLFLREYGGQVFSLFAYRALPLSGPMLFGLLVFLFFFLFVFCCAGVESTQSDDVL